MENKTPTENEREDTTMLNENQKEISKAIIEQLGGGRFAVMTGAKNFVMDGENKLSFKIGNNSKRINYVSVTLNGNDLYDMSFIWATVKGVKVVAEEHDVYNDQLQSMFTKNTGLYTNLCIA